MDDRIDKFLSVLSQRLATDDRYVWQDLYEALLGLCETDEQKQKLIDGYSSAMTEVRLAKWDERFYQAIIGGDAENTIVALKTSHAKVAKSLAASMESIKAEAMQRAIDEAVLNHTKGLKHDYESDDQAY